MEFGVEIVPYSSPKKVRKLGERVEEAGFDHLWVSDHYHNRYVHSILAHIADSTERIKLGPGVTNPYLHHPSVTAAATATLDELSDGRANLGISAGDYSFLNSVGITPERPISRLREAIKIIRGLLGGEKLDFSGEFYTCNKAKLGFSPLHDVPLYIGGRKEQMMNLAGEVADGALFNASHIKDLEECMSFVEEGAQKENRDIGDFDKVAYLAVSIGENEEKAREKSKAITSFIAASAPESTIEREDLSKNKIERIQKYLKDGDTKKAKKEVTEEMLDIFSVSGKPEKLERRIEDLRKTEITQIVIGSPLGPDTKTAIEKIEDIIN